MFRVFFFHYFFISEIFSTNSNFIIFGSKNERLGSPNIIFHLTLFFFLSFFSFFSCFSWFYFEIVKQEEMRLLNGGLSMKIRWNVIKSQPRTFWWAISFIRMFFPLKSRFCSWHFELCFHNEKLTVNPFAHCTLISMMVYKHLSTTMPTTNPIDAHKTSFFSCCSKLISNLG